MYVGMCVLSLSLTHTENEGINNEGNMRQLRGLKAMLHLTDNGKDKPATEVMYVKTNP